ncbi:P-loop containing nucleoside triphosphate hydrolase protein [Kockovaella imperatae]|uniref:p-loop containing nucleoside triphosphate hydrolase protein n=1 Tax=Kockovaella imperatae TaxID=4999 RepID=A0A1Y1UI44_9TREE|nr:P-loop containing nucleoside triphosphate hydrolase protein [Kockovaella imperatae]ORX37207.1 P-loop containing nucleoside triphosphate hydrolase protein [Kockovaella imperatae]
MPKPGRLNLVSARDPLEGDDFEEEVLRDTDEYNRLQSEKNLGTKSKQRAPRKRKTEDPRSSYWQDANSSDLESSSDLEPRHRKRDNNRELQYEGQVLLPFNPLERMAALDPEEPLIESPTRICSVTENITESFSVQSPVAEATPPFSGSTERNQPGSEVDDEETGQDYDYEDEIVIVPDMDQIVGASSVSALEANTLNETHALDQEDGCYSEDEMFADTSTQSQPQAIPRPNVVPESRPSFRMPFDPSLDHPLILDSAEPDIQVPASINRYLKVYQRQGAEFLFRKYRQGTGAILGDDMGLGKTIQVIAFLSAIMRKSGTVDDYRRRKSLIRRGGRDIPPKFWPTAMIVCPKFLLKNWQRELDTWGFFETASWLSDNWKDTQSSFLRGYLDIVLISYETARIHIETIKAMPISVVIADEAHRLKEPRAAVSLALKKIQHAQCFALTGTLIQNRIDEMWSVLDFVQRGNAGTIREWREFAVNPIKMGHRREGTAKEVVEAIQRLGIMVTKVLPRFYLRRDKRLIANELPIKKDLVVFCPLGDNQVVAYKELIASDDVQFILRRNDPCGCGSDLARMHCCHPANAADEPVKFLILKYINALVKVSNHLALLYQAKDDASSSRDVNKGLFRICMGVDYNPRQHSAIAAALDPSNCGKWPLLSTMLREWREEDADNKVLIFSNSVRLLKMVAEFISTSLSYSFDILTGEVDTNTRMDMVDRFQDPKQDLYILLISTMAGGVGLNLTAANKVVIFDPAWNPANDLQAMDRAFRIGQKRTVDVYRLIGLGTLEELMYERQVHKQQRARQLNEGTFERRIHQGYDGARGKADQGELFGTHNIFKFDPRGFMKGNLERVMLAEDQFVQDMVETRYEEEDELEESELEDDDGGSQMRNARRARDLRKAAQTARERQEKKAVLANVLGEESHDPRVEEDSMLKRLGVHSHVHNEAFKDSPQERRIFEIGLQLLQTNPELAKKTKANELGKISKSAFRAPGIARSTSTKRQDADEEPWSGRFETVKRRKGKSKPTLAELSD